VKTLPKYTLYPCFFPTDEFDNIQVPPPLRPPLMLQTSSLLIRQFIYHGSYGGAFRARALHCDGDRVDSGTGSSVVIKRLDLHAVPTKQYAHELLKSNKM
jgi:hypothetical protein